jgi:hypothetical protein
MKLCLLVGVVCVVGCADRVVGPPGSAGARRELAGLALPEANEGLPRPADGDAPNVVLSGDALSIDGESAGRVAELLNLRSAKRLDLLFLRLKTRREAWKAQHAGEPLTGCVVLWFDRSTPLWVFKSVFQTAAFAAYPSFELAVRDGGAIAHGVRYLPFDARVPWPAQSDAPPLTPFEFHVEVTPARRVQLVWKVGLRVERVDEVGNERESLETRLPLLAKMVERSWRSYGGHVSANDRERDQATLHLPNELDLATAVGVLDAVYAPKRPLEVDGKLLQVPAFSVTLSMN